MKKKYKVIGVIFSSLCIFLVGIYFLAFEEIKNIYIDRYNFKQLEKVKAVLKDVPKEELKFRDLSELNKKYDAGIVPKKNCYYTVTTNHFSRYEGDSLYVFGFQLESERYKKKYGGEYYAYPKYDLPEDVMCFPIYSKGLESDDISCDDMQYFYYTNIISSPCRN